LKREAQDALGRVSSKSGDAITSVAGNGAVANEYAIFPYLKRDLPVQKLWLGSQPRDACQGQKFLAAHQIKERRQAHEECRRQEPLQGALDPGFLTPAKSLTVLGRVSITTPGLGAKRGIHRQRKQAVQPCKDNNIGYHTLL
jgi:hypothetical protein